MQTLGFLVIATFLPLLASAADPTDKCITDPTQKDCENYQLDNTWIKEKLKGWCEPDSMYMTSCTLRSHCESDGVADSKYCTPFSLYKTACHEMPGMCTNVYGKLCADGSVVKECKTEILPIPSSAILTNLTYDICITDHMYGMAGCDQCWTPEGGKKKCNAFAVYSELCLAMTMDSCQTWASICELIPDWSLCPGGSHLPQMQMFFHFSIYDYILFQEWVPQTVASYVLAVFGTFFFAIIAEGLKALRDRLELKWRHQIREKIPPQGFSSLAVQTDSQKVVRQPFILRIEVQKGIIKTLDTFFHYSLMLIAMTFNVGLFLAVVLGSGVGSIVWAPLHVVEVHPAEDIQDRGCH